MSKPSKDKDRILDMNLELADELTKDEQGEAHKRTEICKNWILRLIKSAVNGTDPKTNRPTLSPGVQTHKQYATLISELDNVNEEGKCRLTFKSWQFANSNVQRGNVFLQDDVAKIVAQVSDKLASATIVEEEAPEQEEANA